MKLTARTGLMAAATLVAGVAPSVGMLPHASATTGPVQQLAAYCQTTTDGTACVGVNRQVVDSRIAYSAVFRLVPAAGHVMRPVSWQAVNPGFFTGDRSLCTSTCSVVSKPWTKVIGSMSVESVIRFTYYTPGASHAISAGHADYSAVTANGGLRLRETTTYASANNVIGTITNTGWSTVNGPQQPAYVRIFDSLNRTLATGHLCPLNGTAPCSGPENLSQVGTYGVNNAQGSAALLPSTPGHYVSLTAENAEFRTR